MQIKTYKNHFLIAMPSITGEFFEKSVVYIYEHSENNGAIGFIINKPLSAMLSNVLEYLNIKITDKNILNLPVFSGGPVGPDQGFVMHDSMQFAENDNDDDDVLISTSREILKDIAEGHGPKKFSVILGYAGWEPGQLELEIQENDWIVAPFQQTILFETPVSQRWKMAAKSIGLDLTKLSSQTGHA